MEATTGDVSSTAVLSLRPCISPNFLLSQRSSRSNYDNRKSCGVVYLNPKLLRSPSRHFNELWIARCSSTSQGPMSDDKFYSGNQDVDLKNRQRGGLRNKWMENSAEMSAKPAKLGLAAVLAYGLFDGVTYTSLFTLAFLGPFMVAGAAALAPIIDTGLRRIQKYYNFPNLVYAYTVVVAIVAGSRFSVIGLPILSRWGK